MKPNRVTHLKLFSTNGAGIKNGKVGSLNAEVQSTQSNIVTLQETHCTQKGRIRMNKSFVIFEAIRKRKGGGTLVAIHEDLNPKLIAEYDEEFELIVVEVDTEDKSIRVISGYGPQENWQEDKRLPFFIALETEIEKAELAGKSVLIELDANSKLGPSYIAKDPHNITPNGTLLAAIIERQNLVIGNASDKCVGTITRKRVTRNRIEESVIDIIMFSNDLKNHMVKMHVDEERSHVLTRIRKTKNGIKVKESDHNVLLAEFSCKIPTTEKQKSVEVYNLKNREGQENFRKYTNETKMLSSTIDEEGDINKVIARFIKKLNGCIAVNFQKKRVNRKGISNKNKDLYDRMRQLKLSDDVISKKELIKVTEAIAKAESDNFKKLKDELDKLKIGDDKVDSKQLWKLKRRLCPNIRDAPCAMNDSEGNLVTSDRALQKQAQEVFSQRLEGNTIEPHLEDLQDDVNNLCEIRVKLSESKKSENWTMEDLKTVLKQLDNDKARDPEGHANELYKEGVAGEDLLEATLKIMNMIKNKQQYPNILEKCNISLIHKKKVQEGI